MQGVEGAHEEVVRHVGTIRISKDKGGEPFGGI